MTVWSAKLTVRGAGVVVAVVEVVVAGAKMVSAEAKAEVTAAGRPVRGENPPVAEENLSMFLVLTVLILVCTRLEGGNCWGGEGFLAWRKRKQHCLRWKQYCLWRGQWGKFL